MDLETLIKSYLRVPPPGTGEGEEAEDQLYNGPTLDDQEGESKHGTGQQFHDNVRRIFSRVRPPQPQATTPSQPPNDKYGGQDADQSDRDGNERAEAGPVVIEGNEGDGPTEG